MPYKMSFHTSCTLPARSFTLTSSVTPYDAFFSFSHTLLFFISTKAWRAKGKSCSLTPSVSNFYSPPCDSISLPSQALNAPSLRTHPTPNPLSLCVPSFHIHNLFYPSVVASSAFKLGHRTTLACPSHPLNTLSKPYHHLRRVSRPRTREIFSLPKIQFRTAAGRTRHSTPTKKFRYWCW